MSFFFPSFFLCVSNSRKITARKKRKDRKQTQGVPTDLMEQISKHKEPDSSTVSILNTSSDIDQDVASDSNHDNNSTEENSPEEKRKRTFSSSKTSYDSPDSSGDRSHKKEDAGSRPVMSSYKPRTRPSSKILMNAVSWAQQQSSQESGDSSAPSPKMADVVEQKMRAESTIKSHGKQESHGKQVQLDRIRLAINEGVFVCLFSFTLPAMQQALSRTID